MKSKKLCILATALVGTLTANAEPVYIGETGYATLAAAINAAQTGATILVKDNIEIQEELQPKSKTLIIKGDGNKYTATLTADAAHLFNLRNVNAETGQIASNLTIENLILQGSEDHTVSDALINVPDGATLTLTDVAIQGFKLGTKATAYPLRAVNSATVNLTNVVFADNTKQTGFTDIIAPHDATSISISGNCTFSIQPAKNPNITASGLTNTTPIEINYTNTISSGTSVTLIKGTVDTDKFTLREKANYYIAPALTDNAIKLLSNPIFYNVNTGEMYQRLVTVGETKGAYTTANDGDTIYLYGDKFNFTANIGNSNLNKAVTICGATPDATITRGNDRFHINAATGDTFTIENIKFVSNLATENQANAPVRVNGGTVTLKNVTFDGFNLTASRTETNNDKETTYTAAGVITNSGGTLTLDNVKIENSVMPDGVAAQVNPAKGSSLTLAGECSFSLALPEGFTAAGSGLTEGTAIELVPATPNQGVRLVTGCTNPTYFSLDESMTEKWFLTQEGNDIVLAAKAITLPTPSPVGQDNQAGVVFYDEGKRYGAMWVNGFPATITFDGDYSGTLEYQLILTAQNAPALYAEEDNDGYTAYTKGESINVSGRANLKLRYTDGGTTYETAYMVYDKEEGALTGIGSIGTDTLEAEVRYYDLRGVEISADCLAPGLYIRRQGDKTTKIIIR